MKTRQLQWIALTVILAATCATHVGCPDAASPFVFFADAALEAAVRDALGLPLGILTRIQLLELRTLDVHEEGISNLSGIEYCVNLQYLDLDGNDVSNITPLGNLTDLTTVNLDNNNVFDVSALAGLLNLTGLHLCGNNVSDIQPLVTNSINGGLGPGDYVVLDKDALDDHGETIDLPFLEAMGVNVVDCDGDDEE